MPIIKRKSFSVFKGNLFVKILWCCYLIYNLQQIIYDISENNEFNVKGR